MIYNQFLHKCWEIVILNTNQQEKGRKGGKKEGREKWVGLETRDKVLIYHEQSQKEKIDSKVGKEWKGGGRKEKEEGAEVMRG